MRHHYRSSTRRAERCRTSSQERSVRLLFASAARRLAAGIASWVHHGSACPRARPSKIYVTRRWRMAICSPAPTSPTSTASSTMIRCYHTTASAPPISTLASKIMRTTTFAGQRIPHSVRRRLATFRGAGGAFGRSATAACAGDGSICRRPRPINCQNGGSAA